MAVGEIVWPHMHPVSGVELGVANARIKDSDANDLLVIKVSERASVAGVFTQNAFCAEPVRLCKANMLEAKPRYLIVNSGNANACTGELGWQAAVDVCEALASEANADANTVLPFSTGVIGEVLPSDKIVAVIPEALASLHEANWLQAAQAIMTTDTQPKGASVSIDIDGQTCCVTGISKGAGMIRPNMATMLAFVATDAVVDPSILHILCKRAADASFNRITIDGDTSTNDACMLIASGEQSAVTIDRIDSKNYQLLEDAIISVFQQLAQSIVRDGEGATKYIEVKVEGGENNKECLDVAYEIAHSPLVKTAAFASDPNWGRIVMAIGKADVHELDSDSVSVWINDVMIVDNGGRAASYTEEAGQAEMNKTELLIRVALGRGKAHQSIWTTDLSHEYVKINAEYRT